MPFKIHPRIRQHKEDWDEEGSEREMGSCDWHFLCILENEKMKQNKNFSTSGDPENHTKFLMVKLLYALSDVSGGDVSH